MLELLSICALYALSEMSLCRSQYYDAKSDCQYYYAFDKEAGFQDADADYAVCASDAKADYSKCRGDVVRCDD